MEQSLTTMLLQSIAALAAVLALFAVMVWGVKRFQGYSMPQQVSGMRVLQRVSLDSRHSLVEVQRGDTHYVLALSSSSGVRMIETFHQPEIVKQQDLPVEQVQSDD